MIAFLTDCTVSSPLPPIPRKGSGGSSSTTIVKLQTAYNEKFNVQKFVFTQVSKIF